MAKFKLPFKTKPAGPETKAPEAKLPEAKLPKAPRQINWVKVLTISNIVIVALAAITLGGMAVIHQSDTNPSFCGLCHIMQPNVNSYLTSNHLDNAHAQAGVQCKDCHNYPVSAEVTSGVNFIMGNYEVSSSGQLLKREYSDEMCLKCHVSQAHVADATDYLYRNPHNSHWGFIKCSSCHVSHGTQIDYCSSCHDHGKQRMIEDTIEDRGKIGKPSASTN